MKPRHYWLIAGQVHYTAGEAPYQRNINTVLATKERHFARADIGKAQQMLQLSLMRSFKDQLPADIQITDVFMISVNWLGFMTDEQFQKGYDELVQEQSVEAAPNAAH